MPTAIEFVKENALVLSASAVAIAGFWRQAWSLATSAKGLVVRKVTIDGTYLSREILLFTAHRYPSANNTSTTFRIYADQRTEKPNPVAVKVLPSTGGCLRKGKAGIALANLKDGALVIDYIVGTFRPEVFFAEYADWLAARNENAAEADRFQIHRTVVAHAGIGGVALETHATRKDSPGIGREDPAESPASAFFGGRSDNVDAPAKVWELDAFGRSTAVPPRKFGAFDSYVCGKSADEVRHVADRWFEKEQWYKSRDIRWKTGVLLEGPPGTGKTQLAVALARHYKIPLVCLSLGDYVAFPTQLRASWRTMTYRLAPLIVLVDEVDRLLDEETSKTLLPILLECVDGAETKDGVFLIAVTNNKDKLPPALMRRGRIDKVVNVGLPEPAIREAYLRKILEGAYDPAFIEKTAGKNFPDMLQFCLDRLEENERKNTNDPEQIKIGPEGGP